MPARRTAGATRRPRRAAAKAAKVLERVKITVAGHSWPGVHVVRATLGRREIGYMEVEEIAGPRGQGLMKVAFVEVQRKGLGIGTKLYEKAARFACGKRLPLASDMTRTPASQGFWEKQAGKGRATCLRGSGRATALSPRFVEKGEWACGQYALTCPAPRSLAAVRLTRG